MGGCGPGPSGSAGQPQQNGYLRINATAGGLHGRLEFYCHFAKFVALTTVERSFGTEQQAECTVVRVLYYWLV